MINKQVLVCPNRCYDQPQEQLRAIVLPPDPPPVWQPRPEQYLVDEDNPTQRFQAQMNGLSLPVSVLFLDLVDIHGNSVLEAFTGSTARTDFAGAIGAPVNGFSFNNALIRFATFTLDTADIDFIQAWDASSGGNMLSSAPVLPAQAVTQGSGLVINTGGLRLG